MGAARALDHAHLDPRRPIGIHRTGPPLAAPSCQSEKGTSEYAFIPNLDDWWAWSGEASLGFWGALNTATVDVVEDPIVGFYAYGGDLERTEGTLEVTPRDGVRQRLTVLPLDRFGLDLAGLRYTAAVIAEDLSQITLQVEVGAAGSEAATVTVRNLPSGSYTARIDGKDIRRLAPRSAPERIEIGALQKGTHEVTITRAGSR